MKTAYNKLSPHLACLAVLLAVNSISKINKLLSKGKHTMVLNTELQTLNI